MIINYRRYRFVVRVELIKVWPLIVRNEYRSSNNHVLAIVAKQTALSVQLLLASVHVHNMLKLEEPFEDFTADVVEFIPVYVRHQLLIPVLADQIGSSCTATKLVNLQ